MLHNIFSFFAIAMTLAMPMHISAQKYSRGVMEYGLIDIQLTPNSTLDSAFYNSIRDGFERELKMTLSFIDSTCVVEKLIQGDIPQRTVYNYQENIAYHFNALLGQPSYRLEQLYPPQEKPYDISQFEKPVKPGKKFFGLKCMQYNLNIDNKRYEFTVTKDIALVSPAPENMLDPAYGAVIQIGLTDNDLGVSMKFGALSFKPSIPDTSIFSVDTTGLQNHTKLANEFLESIKEAEEQEKLKSLEFGQYESSSININLIHKLVEMGAFSEKDYEIKRTYGSNENYDIPNVLFLALRSDTGLPHMGQTEIMYILDSIGIMSPKLLELLTMQEDVWLQIPAEVRYKAVCLAALKDHLNKEETKEMIVKNLEHMEYADFGNSEIDEEFINKNVSLVDLLAEIKYFTKLASGEVIGDSALYKQITSFYKAAFHDTGINIDFHREDNRIIVIDKENTHTINLNDFKSIIYSQEYYDYDESDNLDLVYNDTVKLNYYFYSRLIDLVKQIGADNNSGKAYSVYHFNPPYNNGISEERYHEIIEICPFLALEEAFYFQQFPRESYMVFYDVGTSFPYHPDGFENQVTLGNFLVGDIDAGVDFVKTSQKVAFLKYLKDHHNSLGISETDLENTSNRILDNLIKGTDALLEELPNCKITISKWPSFSDDMFIENISASKLDFRAAYPDLYSVIGDDFDATEFSYDSTSNKVEFTYQENRFSIPVGDNSMVVFLLQNLKNTPSGKKLYSVRSMYLHEHR